MYCFHLRELNSQASQMVFYIFPSTVHWLTFLPSFPNNWNSDTISCCFLWTESERKTSSESSFDNVAITCLCYLGQVVLCIFPPNSCFICFWKPGGFPKAPNFSTPPHSCTMSLQVRKSSNVLQWMECLSKAEGEPDKLLSTVIRFPGDLHPIHSLSALSTSQGCSHVQIRSEKTCRLSGDPCKKSKIKL